MSQENKVGVFLSGDYLPAHKIIEFSPLLDDLGYHQISIPEIWGHDSITLLSVLAHTTKKIKLATGIISLFSRTPALVGMTAASLDELSRGRFILGLGLSGPKVIENWHGIPFKSPLTRTEEFVEILRSIFRRERMDFDTKELGHLKDFRISVPNVRKDIPIHLASIGPKNIELTAKIADGWIPIFMPLEEFSKEIKGINLFLEKYGRDKSNFEITPAIPTIIGNGEKEKELLRSHLGYYFGSMGDFYNNLLRRVGFEKEADEIKRHYMDGDVLNGNRAISDEILHEVCIFGSKDEALEKVAKLHKIGVTCPLLVVPFRTPLELAQNTYQTLAPKNMNV